MMLSKCYTRRDRCYVIGRRSRRLTRKQAADAWYMVSNKLADDFSRMDIPKFNDLLIAIEVARRIARKAK